jgi:hypothetical protein
VPLNHRDGDECGNGPGFEIILRQSRVSSMDVGHG